MSSALKNARRYLSIQIFNATRQRRHIEAAPSHGAIKVLIALFI